MNTLQKIIVGASIICSVYGCNSEKNALIPVPEKNQRVVLSKNYLNGTDALGYTLLTDIDGDGTWDCAEKVRAGYTTGDYQQKLFYKKGFGPAQTIPSNIPVNFVDKEFFKPYQ